MGNKTHYKIKGIDHRDRGQLDHDFNNQAACGYSGVIVTKIKKDVNCNSCLVTTAFNQANDDVIKRMNTINDIEAELQCMESCLAQGFTLQDYIDTHKHLVEILLSLNT